MATKRRKVWVTFKGEKQKEPAALNATAADAADISKWYGTRAVPMVERLPGDVVLSRETHKRLEDVLVNAQRAWGRADDATVKDALDAALALLRGRR